MSSVGRSGKTNDMTPTFSRGADEPQPRDVRQAFGAVLEQIVLVLADVGQSEAVDVLLRLLRGRGIVEPDQRLAMNMLVKNREISRDGRHVERTRAMVRESKHLTSGSSRLEIAVAATTLLTRQRRFRLL